MALRFQYLRPDPLPKQNDKVPVSATLTDWYRMFRRAVRELDHSPVLTVAMASAQQTLTASATTTVSFDTVVLDSHGWWDSSASAYTPQEYGYYRANWCIDFHDSGSILASTYAYAQLNVGSGTPYRFLQYGNGSAHDIMVSGSAIVLCNGSTDALSVSGLIFAGTAPTIYQEAASYRSWFSVDYIGRDFVST